MDTFSQKMLDKVSENIDQEMIELHSIYCPCERCTAQQEKEKERRAA